MGVEPKQETKLTNESGLGGGAGAGVGRWVVDGRGGGESVRWSPWESGS